MVQVKASIVTYSSHSQRLVESAQSARGIIFICLYALTLYCIVLYLLPVLNPKSYDGARVLEASGRPMLVIGRSYWFVPIQNVDVNAEAGTKLAEEATEKSSVTGIIAGKGCEVAGTKLITYRGGNS